MQPIEGAVIACAGLGSRLGMGLPKCMIEIDGRTILSRLIRSLRPHVPRIHVVVGYREEIIEEYCARYYRDVVLVRNPDFRSTNTAHSLRLGSIGFRHKALYMDGDLLLSEKSLAGFLSHASEVPLLIGVTPAKTSEAVFAATREREDDGSLVLEGFDRAQPSRFEWANVFAGPPDIVSPGNGYVFESLAGHLPAAAHELQLFEVDTAADLTRAVEGLPSLGGSDEA